MRDVGHTGCRTRQPEPPAARLIAVTRHLWLPVLAPFDNGIDVVWNDAVARLDCSPFVSAVVSNAGADAGRGLSGTIHAVR